MSLTDHRSSGPSRAAPANVEALFPAVLGAELSATEDETVLTLHGDLDLWTHQAFSNALGMISDDAARVVLDLSDVTFMDAGTLGMIYRARALAESRGNAVVLRSPSLQVRRLLDIIGFPLEGSVRPILLPLPSLTYERRATL